MDNVPKDWWSPRIQLANVGASVYGLRSLFHVLLFIATINLTFR
jgi:hypothetical protein